MYPVCECILIFSCQVCPSQHAPDQTTQHSLEFVTETGRHLSISSSNINLADRPEDAIDNEVDAAVDRHEEVISLSEFVICFPNMLKQKTI